MRYLTVLTVLTVIIVITENLKKSITHFTYNTYSVTTWKQEMLAHLKRKEFTAICYYQEICAIVQYLQKSNSIQVEGTLATFANAAGNKEISAWLTPIGRGTRWEYLKTTENIFQRQFWFEKRKNPSRNNSKETLSPLTERGNRTKSLLFFQTETRFLWTIVSSGGKICQTFVKKSIQF